MKKTKQKVNAAIIIIGNEILSGRTQDVNVVNISNWLNQLGVFVEEVRIIPDIENVIIKTVKEMNKKFTYIFTTGGIGPTHDDITSKSISKVFNMSYGYHEKAYKLLEQYYGKENFTPGRKKMAMIPKKAGLILNPSSGAPGFYIKNVYCLPGVPSILTSMLGGLENKIKGGKKILTKTITARTVESEIAKSLTKIQNKFFDTDIGSYPFFKQGKIGVSIVVRSTRKKKIDECSNEIVSFLKKKKINILGKK